MSDQVNIGHVKQYASRTQHLLQQRGSKLYGCVTQHSFTGKAAQIVQQIGAVEAHEIKNRHADTELTDTPHAARWMRPTDYGVADMVDRQDLARMIINPSSPYAEAQRNGLGRKVDDHIIDACLGIAYTGEDGLDTVTAANDGVHDSIVAGGVGLTVEKLRDGVELLLASEVDIDSEEIWVIMAASQWNDLMGQPQFTGGDYRSGRPMESKSTNQGFLGLNYKVCNRLTLDSNSDRQVLMFAKSRVHVGMWNGIMTEVDRRPDKWGNTQVATTGTFGAARSEGEGIVVIPCVE